MEKIDAARRAEGIIQLGAETAELIKKAINQVSTIEGQDGDLISFAGQRVAEGAGYGLIVNCFDVYECPDGYLMHVYMDDSPNWAVSAKTIPALLAAIPHKAIARRVHGELVKKGLASNHTHF